MGKMKEETILIMMMMKIFLLKVLKVKMKMSLVDLEVLVDLIVWFLKDLQNLVEKEVMIYLKKGYLGLKWINKLEKMMKKKLDKEEWKANNLQKKFYPKEREED